MESNSVNLKGFKSTSSLSIRRESMVLFISFKGRIDEKAEPGNYTVNLDIIATGYKPLGISKTYIVNKE